MDEPIACPQCGAPAQITERFWLASTAGPVEHLKTGCIKGSPLGDFAVCGGSYVAGRMV